MIERLAARMANSIYTHAEDSAASVPVLKYALIIIMDFLLVTSLSLVLGAFTGKLAETAIGMLCFLVLRAISGGYHLNTSVGCVILSTSISVLIPHIPLTSTAANIIASTSVVLFIIFAPANLQNQSRIPSRLYPTLKVVSSVIVISSFFIKSDVITMAIFIQALSLIHYTKRKEVNQDD